MSNLLGGEQSMLEKLMAAQERIAELEAHAIIAAHIAKQREPETVKFRAAHKNGKVEMLQADLQLGKEFDWEWLDADGKPQEFEVKV